MLDLKEFLDSVSRMNPPAGSSVNWQSLWYDARGDWEMAHQLVNPLEDPSAYEIHAYLHRKEGDLVNAAYWYQRAGKPFPRCSPAEEWESLCRSLMVS